MNFLLRALRFLRTIPPHYWAWIHAFLALGIGWGSAIAFNPPPSYQGVVDLSTIFRMGATTAVGAILATVALLMSRSLNNRRRVRALWLELVGAILLAGGPLQYCSLQIGFLLQGQFDQRYSLAWFAYSCLAFMLVRFTILVPLLRKERAVVRLQEGKR